MSTNKCALGNAAGPSSGECRDWCYAVPLKVLSMNVYGRDLTNVTSRATRLMQIIRAENADFVLLQEVEDWFLQALQQQPFARSYHASDFGSGHAPGGLLILSKVPLSSVAYYEKTMPGQVEVDQRGRVLVVTPRIGRGNLAVATTTLDWRSGENRASSLDYIFSVLAPAQNVVLGGDFNFDFGAQPETSRLPSRYLDVWRVLRPRQPGFTWDPINNSYARNSDPNSRQSRIDRVFVSSSFTRLLDVQKIGASDVSPHYGLSVRVRMFGAYC
jgi:endonuclease/exonuclease/phosphatase family metal-dependent hydrolase